VGGWGLIMNYGYSAKTNIFYVLEDQEAYETNNNWPDDVKPVSVEHWEKYRVMLNRLDITTVPDIDWPSAPDA